MCENNESNTQLDTDELTDIPETQTQNSVAVVPRTASKAAFAGMVASLGMAGVIVAGFVLLKLTRGGYHDWVFFLFVGSLLLGNVFRQCNAGRLRVYSVVFVVLFCLVVSLFAYAKTNAHKLMGDVMFESFSTEQYYDDNFIWHGPIHKESGGTFGCFGSSEYSIVYDRQGNVISKVEEEMY
jgi:hypothetical protein